jgi:hypothetical protein
MKLDLHRKLKIKIIIMAAEIAFLWGAKYFIADYK